MDAPSAPDDATPYDRVGGEAGVRAIVDAFYEIMASSPQYRALRSLHDADLAPMRASLAQFLSGWLGGPRD